MSDLDPAERRKQEDEVRVARAGARWRARSRRVKLYRRLLPIVILTLAGGALSWTVLRTLVSGAERRAGETQEVRLDKPRFHGQDALGRTFVIGAEGAVRDAATGRFRLVGPALKLNLGGRKVTELTADGGLYDEANDRVVIGPNVRISDGGSGLVLVTPEAVVDTHTGVVSGNRGVQASGPLGTVSASAYVIRDQGARVEFLGSGDNKVRGTLNPAPSGG